jgi:RHS repeat-associated protein
VRYKYKYNSKELQNELGLAWYDYGARNYEASLGRWMNLDPLSEKYTEWTPYNYTMNNPVRYIDPAGLDTLDVTRNKNGIWKVTNYQRAKGNDVIRVSGKGVQRTDYIFSEGEYGERVIALNLEVTDDYTLGIVLISDPKYVYEEGSYSFYVTPGGEADNRLNSNKRLEDGLYIVGATTDIGSKWYQPWVISPEVRYKGIKFHPMASKTKKFGNPRGWTKGCFVLFSEYLFDKKGKLRVKTKNSKFTSMFFNLQLGASELYNQKGSKDRPGAEFPEDFRKPLIIRTR